MAMKVGCAELHSAKLKTFYELFNSRDDGLGASEALGTVVAH